MYLKIVIDLVFDDSHFSVGPRIPSVKFIDFNADKGGRGAGCFFILQNLHNCASSVDVLFQNILMDIGIESRTKRSSRHFGLSAHFTRSAWRRFRAESTLSGNGKSTPTSTELC